MMLRGTRVWVNGVEIRPEVYEVAIGLAPADIAPYVDGMQDGSIDLDVFVDGGTLEHDMTPDEWAAFTEHVVISDRPGEL